MTARIAVLGAGPAGLGAAYRAARAGHDVVVLEGAPRVGGAAASFGVAGIRVDYGSHRLHPSIDPAIRSELESLGAGLQRRARNGRIRLGGRWIAFPLRPVDLAARLPPRLALGAARDAAVSWARRPRADTYAEVLRAGLGPALCDAFYFPYARKLWGLEPGEIAAEQARRRVSAASPGALLRRVASRSRPFFWYPARGFGAIAEALAGAAAAAGADIRQGTPVRAVELGPDGAAVATDAGAVDADLVWSTIPLTALAGMTSPPPPEHVIGAASELRHRAVAFVYLVVGADRYTPFDAHYLPEPFTPVARVSEPKNYRDGDDPGRRTVLCCEIPCDPHGDLFGAPDGELVEIALAGLAGAGLPEPPVTGAEVRRLARVYPVYRTGYEAALSALDVWAGSHARLLTFGRQGLFVHDNTHHALAMAWAAAGALGAGGFDGRAWSAARGRFAAHVVED